jgi:hypothetical protein
MRVCARSRLIGRQSSVLDDVGPNRQLPLVETPPSGGHNGWHGERMVRSLESVLMNALMSPS